MSTASRPSEFDYARAAERLERFVWLAAAIGAVISTLTGHWPSILGFLAGAAIGILNFRWLKRGVGLLGRSERPPKLRSAVFLGMRYVFLGLALYAMMNFFGNSLMAVLAGLLIPVAAAILEILYELIYART